MTRTNPERFRPAYLDLYESGELDRRVAEATDYLTDCVLCGRECHADRIHRPKSANCRVGERAVVDGFGPHHGEEDVLRGHNGSGTIFFSWCNLRCQFCQNWEISQCGRGREVGPDQIATMMLRLQELGCHNINLVSASHVVVPILKSLRIAVERGLRLPLVFNSGGYDSPVSLALLDGVIDIYLPDMKYGDSATARLYSKVRNYASVSRRAVAEMHRQVGELQIGEDGIARRGLLVRHLVLPESLANTGMVMKFIARELSKNTCVNVMDQYTPCYRADDYPPLARTITTKEYQRAMALARKYGLHRFVDARSSFVSDVGGRTSLPLDRTTPPT